MQDSNLLIYIAGEIALVLLAVCIFLCFHVKSLKSLIVKLEDKINSLRQSVKASRKETKSALKKLAAKEKIKPKEFLDYLDEEIHGTLNHHKSLNPDRDIVLDITSDAPMERQAASLRHAFLIAEKEARFAGDEKQSSWDVLQSKLQQIIQFYESAAPAEQQADDSNENDDKGVDSQEIDNYKKQIENLNRYKKLYFDTEKKWQDAKEQADEYYQKLMAKTKDMGDEELTALLENYSHVYDDIESILTDEDDNRWSTNGDDSSVGQMVIANQEEMQRLRNMAVDQHKVITDLKNKLVGAKSPEEHQQALEEVTQQLEQQQRFLKEAETCTQLIEDELSRTIEENQTLREQLDAGGSGSDIDGGELNKLESLVEELTGESEEMLRTIAALEEENQSLKQTTQASNGNASAEDTDMLKEKLSQMQQELLNMQTQHIELEERYLELKMASD